MKRKHILSLFVLTLWLCADIVAQNLVVRAPGSAYLNEGFTVKYSISCQDRPSNFVPPTVTGGKIVSGPYTSSSSQTTIINGQMSSSHSYTFSIVIQASKAGKVNISPAQVKAGGKVYTSQSAIVDVSNNASASSQQRNNYNNQQRSYSYSYSSPNYSQQQSRTPNTRNQATPSQTEINIDNSALFVRAIPNKTNVTLGEEIVISYKLYTTLPVSEYSIPNIPTTTGFWVEELDEQEKPTLSIEMYNGQRYQVATLKKVIVYPQRSGALTIKGMPVEVLAHIATHSRRQFTTGDPFFDSFLSDPMFSSMMTSYQKVKKKVNTNPIYITVNELPKPLPKEYCGAVGSFGISGSSTTNRIKAFDAFYLTYTLTGNGNLTLINSLPLNLPEEFQISDPEITDHISRTSSGMSGSRTFKYLVIPSVEGNFKIPDLTITYFDTKSREYKTISCEGFAIHVDKGDASSGYAKQLDQRAKFRNMDIRAFLYNSAKGKEHHIFDKSFIFFLPLIFVVLLAVAIFFYSRHLDFMADVVNMKRKRATRVAIRRLKKARKLLKQEKFEAFEDEIAIALWTYLLDRFKIQKSEFSVAACKEKLLQEGISAPVVEELGSIFERCEYIRFSQDKGANADKTIYDDTVNVITSIEEEMKLSKKNTKTLALFVGLVLLSSGLSAQTLQEADRMYNMHNYDSSLVLYQKVAKQEPSATALCGVAASYFRLSDYANSRLYYEKALKLAPNDKNIQLNINIVRSRLMGDCYIMPEFLPIRLAKEVSGVFSLWTWAALMIGLFLISCVAFFLYWFSSDRKVLYFYISLFALILSLSSMGFGICRQNIQNDQENAIIMRSNIPMKPSRSATSKDIMKLYKGQKIRILEDDDPHWIKVRTEDHREGFIESKEYKRI